MKKTDIRSVMNVTIKEFITILRRQKSVFREDTVQLS